MKGAPLRPADGIIAAVTVAVAVLLFAVLRVGAPSGSQVIVETAGRSATVYDLDTPVTVTLEGRDGLFLTMTVADGRVCVSDSNCPDHLCRHAGWLSRGGQSAVCVPAGITLRVVGGNDAVDGVTA